MENTNENENNEQSKCTINHGRVDLIVVCSTCADIVATATMDDYTFRIWIDDPSVLNDDATLEQKISQGTIKSYVDQTGELPVCQKCAKRLRFGLFAEGATATMVIDLQWDKLVKIADSRKFLFKLFVKEYKVNQHRLEAAREWKS